MSAAKRSLNVGVVGMGNMGVPITRNLAFKARSAMYLQIHSRTLSKARQVCDDMSADGATCAMRLHDRYSTMTKWCDVVLLTLAHRGASRKVLLEDDEALIPNARAGQIIVDHTTVDIELSRECAYEAERRGAVFLDATMSGSPKQAFNNQLVLMVGGPAEHVQRVSPIFRMYADSIHHMGASGSGTATKLLSQALVASHNAAAAEAMTMANRLGIEDSQRLMQVLDASWGSSTMLRRNAASMQDLVRNPEKLPPASGANINSLLEDLSLLDQSLPMIRRAGGGGGGGMAAHQRPRVGDAAAAAAAEEEERFPVLDASLRMLGAAAESGLGDRDMAAVIHYIQAAAAMETEEGVHVPPRRLTSSAFITRAPAAPSSPADAEVLPASIASTPTTGDNDAGVAGHTTSSPQQQQQQQREFTMEDFY